MKKLIFILGGARSGKSRYAVELAKGLSSSVAFIATASSFDEEMRKRIKTHQRLRPKYWKIIEEGKALIPILSNLSSKYEVVIIDCISLLISNLLEDNLNDRQIQREIRGLIHALEKSKFTIILVSNEVGMGIIPDNPLARRFRDLLGWANQMITREVDEVIFMHSGIPVWLKGGKKCRN